MTRLLENAIKKVKKLPDGEQDSIAARILDDLKDAQVWAAHFRKTSDAQWDHLAETVRREISGDKTTPIENLFPADTSKL